MLTIDCDVGPQKTCTAQQKAQESVNEMNRKIVSLTTIKDTGLATSSQLKELGRLKTEVKKGEQQLKTLQAGAERQRKFRKLNKEKLEQIKAKLPEDAGPVPGTRDGPGRPRLEEIQPGLLETIIKIVTPDSAADVGRRSELLRSCLTLDDLHSKLQSEGSCIFKTWKNYK